MTALLWLAAAPVWARPPATLALQECRLQHPLRVNSIDARCAEFPVPEDRSTAQSPRISLHLAVISALNRRSRGAPLFILAGGPGQSAIDLYTSYAGAFARINRNHDIVLLDQRGTGASAPLRCRFPEDWSEASNSNEAIRAATKTCLEELGERARHYTTAVAVEDLDAVRAALGYERISLYGASYGTRVAQSYMRRHGPQLDAVIMDGVTDPERPIGPDTPLDGERALNAILERCRTDAACDKAFPQLSSDYAALKTRFGPASVSIKIPDPSGGTDIPVSFNHAVFAASLRLLSYSATQAALLPQLIHQASLGDLKTFAAQAVMTSRQVGDQLAIGMQNTVVCSEDWPMISSSTLDRTELQTTYQGTDQLDGLAVICAHWPKGPVDPDLHAPLKSAVPTLLLSGDADPVTPPPGAERAARFLSRHRHLVLAGEGHGQLATGCVPRLMAEFLDRPDPAALDAGCLSTHRPAAFFVGVNGPTP